MLLTAICDVFATDERGQIRDAALRVIRDNAGVWSPYGVYLFWEPKSREVLYVGIDSNLPRRFAQHTGLIPAPAANCKIDEVIGWFADHDHLGITFVIQSAASLPGPGTAFDDGAEGTMKYGEGQLISAVERRTGGRPPWNKIGGAAAGQAHTAAADHDLMGVDRAFTGWLDSLQLTRLRLRELADDYEAQLFEELLHGARIEALLATLMTGAGVSDHDVLKALERVVLNSPQMLETADRMVRSRYLEAFAVPPHAIQVKPAEKTTLASYYLSPNPAGGAQVDHQR